MNSGKLLLVGILGGLAAGILLAPEKGSRTRRNLTKKSEDIVDSIKDKFDDLIQEFSDKLESAEKEVTGLYKKAGQKADEVSQAIKGHNHSH